MIDRSISRGYRWKVQGRLAVVKYAGVHGIKPAAAQFGLDRKTVRQWRDRARGKGGVGLVPRYRKRRQRRIRAEVVELIAHARREFGWGRLPHTPVADARAPGEGGGQDDHPDRR